MTTLAKMRSRQWMIPTMIIAIALVIRIAVIAADSGYIPEHDAYDYDRHAQSIAAGDGYPESRYVIDVGPTALRPPGYPYALGSVYAVTGDSVTAGRLANAVLGALAVLLIFLITKRIWGRHTALIAAGLAAVFPPLVLLSRDLLSESLFIALLLGAVLAVLAFRGSGARLRWAVLAGLLCGLAAQTRNPGVALVIPIGFGVWTLRPRWTAKALAAPAIVVLCTTLTIVPWTVRNVVEFGQIVPVAASTGLGIAGTYNSVSMADDTHPSAWRNPLRVQQYRPLFVTPGIDEATLDSSLRREATTFAWDHPGYVAQTTARNMLRLFEISGASVVDIDDSPVTTRGIGSADPLSERIAIALAAIFAAFGVYAITQSRTGRSPFGHPVARGPGFMWAVPVVTILTAAPVAGLPRYRVPADPFVLILAAIGITWMWAAWRPTDPESS